MIGFLQTTISVYPSRAAAVAGGSTFSARRVKQGDAETLFLGLPAESSIPKVHAQPVPCWLLPVVCAYCDNVVPVISCATRVVDCFALLQDASPGDVLIGSLTLADYGSAAAGAAKAPEGLPIKFYVTKAGSVSLVPKPAAAKVHSWSHFPLLSMSL